MSENYSCLIIKKKSCHNRNLCMEFRLPSVCAPLCGVSPPYASADCKMDANEDGNSQKRKIQCRGGSEKRRKANRNDESLVVNHDPDKHSLPECSSLKFDPPKRFEHNAAKNRTADNRYAEICKICLERSLIQPWRGNLSYGTHGCFACDKVHKGTLCLINKATPSITP